MADDPAYVKALKEFTKSAPRIEDMKAREAEFYGASDRASGILFGGWVELALETAIKSVLRPDLTSTVAKRLLGFEGAVGTFSAKTDLAYALDIFGPITYHDINLIRLIRNEFAHCSHPLTFDIPAVGGVCSHFQILDSDQKTEPFMFVSLTRAADMLENPADETNPKNRFITACHSIVWGLLNFAKREERNEMQKSKLP